MKIKVLAKHIREGKQGDGRCCPIALSLKEIYKTNKVRVFYTWVYVGESIFHFPKKAITFVKKFDKKKSSVKPFEFEL